MNFARKPKMQDWEVFLNHIRMEGAAREEFEEKYEQILDDFSTHIMGNIHWYEKKIIEEKTIRLAYILISLSLLLLLPLLVAGIQKFTDSIAAEITAILTGFFALYQGAKVLML